MFEMSVANSFGASVFGTLIRKISVSFALFVTCCISLEKGKYFPEILYGLVSPNQGVHNSL